MSETITIDITILTLLTLATSVGIVLLGAYVYVNSQRNQVYFWFQLLLVQLFVWNMAYFLGRFAPDPTIGWYLFVTETVVVAYMGGVVLCLARAYRGWSNSQSLVVNAAFFAAIFYMLVVITNPMHVQIVSEFTMEQIIYGPAYYYGLVLVLLCYCMAAYYFLNGVENPSIYWKNQITYVGNAGIILIGAAFVDAIGIVPMDANLPLIVLPCSLILVGIAVLKYQFLDILPFAMARALNFVEDGYLVFGVNGDLEDYSRGFFDRFIPINNCQTIDDVVDAFSAVMGNVVTLKNLRSSLSVVRDAYISGELVMNTPDGAHHFQYISKAINDPTGLKIATIITLHDITEVQQLHEKLDYQMVELIEARKRLEQHMATVQQLTMETERNRLMTEVHDTIGHSLSEVLAMLEKCDVMLADPASTHEEEINSLTEALDRSREGLAEIRAAVGRFKRMGVSQ